MQCPSFVRSFLKKKKKELWNSLSLHTLKFSLHCGVPYTYLKQGPPQKNLSTKSFPFSIDWISTEMCRCAVRGTTNASWANKTKMVFAWSHANNYYGGGYHRAPTLPKSTRSTNQRRATYPRHWTIRRKIRLDPKRDRWDGSDRVKRRAHHIGADRISQTSHNIRLIIRWAASKDRSDWLVACLAWKSMHEHFGNVYILKGIRLCLRSPAFVVFVRVGQSFSLSLSLSLSLPFALHCILLSQHPGTELYREKGMSIEQKQKRGSL